MQRASMAQGFILLAAAALVMLGYTASLAVVLIGSVYLCGLLLIHSQTTWRSWLRSAIGAAFGGLVALLFCLLARPLAVDEAALFVACAAGIGAILRPLK
jgi:hypothetical protein